MAVSAARPTVTTSPTPLTGGAEGDFLPGRSAVISNPGPAEVLLGGPDVTAGDGYPLAANSTCAADLARGDVIYAVVASGTQEVHVLQAGV